MSYQQLQFDWFNQSQNSSSPSEKVSQSSIPLNPLPVQAAEAPAVPEETGSLALEQKPPETETFYFIDTENVSHAWVPLATKASARDTILLFSSGKSGVVSLAELGVILSQKVKIEYINCFYNHKNALDFQLVAELGRRVEQNPGQKFVIFTKDMGFDAVVSYLRKRNVDVCRISPESGNIICSNSSLKFAPDPLPSQDSRTSSGTSVPEVDKYQMKCVSVLRGKGVPEKYLNGFVAIILQAIKQYSNKSDRGQYIYTQIKARYKEEGLRVYQRSGVREQIRKLVRSGLSAL